MNKNDLITSIASSAKISKREAELGLEGLLETVLAAIKGGERVTLAGFGSFSLVDRAPRTGRNPKTGETIPIPSRRAVKFRPGRGLVEKIRWNG